MCRSLLVLPHPLREGPGARWSPQHLPQASGACATVRAPAAGRPAGLRPSGFRLPASVSRRSLRSSVERVHVPQTGELRSGQGPPRPRAAVCGRAPGQLRWGPGTEPLLPAPVQQEGEEPSVGTGSLGLWGHSDRVAFRDIEASGVRPAGLTPCREDTWCEASDTWSRTWAPCGCGPATGTA